MGKASAPPTPDYVGAAQQTAAGNLETAKYTTAANRVNQVTPYGNLTYSQGAPTVNQSGYDQALKSYQDQLAAYNQPTSSQSYNPMFNNIGLNARGAAPVAPNIKDYTSDSNQWTATQTLTPAQQKILEQNQGLSSGLLDTAQQGLNYAQGVMEKPGVDLSQLPSYGINPGEMYSDAIMRRLAPQIAQQSQQSDAQLANQGIAPGTEAYNNAKRQLAQQQNDLLTSAQINGMNTGLTANQQAFQQQSYNQMQPINVINALRTGSQVQAPSYVNPAQMQNPGGADILGATQAGYNAQLGATNAQNAASGGFMSGLMGLGGAALGAPVGTFSDINLKENIKKVGSLANGINVYSYNYNNVMDLPKGKQIGVIAQEVEKVIPEAVGKRDGFKTVNYALLGV